MLYKDTNKVEARSSLLAPSTSAAVGTISRPKDRQSQRRLVSVDDYLRTMTQNCLVHPLRFTVGTEIFLSRAHLCLRRKEWYSLHLHPATLGAGIDDLEAVPITVTAV